MPTQLTMKGFLYPGGAGGCDPCVGAKGAVAPFELAFRNCFESFGQVRSGDFPIATSPDVFVDLPLTDAFTSIELLALRTSGPLTLRFDGAPAEVLTAALYPVAGLSGLTLSFGVDGYPIAVTFAAGDDTAEDVARRINAAAALAGVPFLPARVSGSQVEIGGQKTGASGVLTAFTGTAAEPLGLELGALGTGHELEVDGLQLWQFRRAQGVRRIEVSGTASVSVLAAGT